MRTDSVRVNQNFFKPSDGLKKFWFATYVVLYELASSRRSVSQGAAQKTAREKNKKRATRGFRDAFLIFLRADFCAAPWLTERLEEAIYEWISDAGVSAGVVFSLLFSFFFTEFIRAWHGSWTGSGSLRKNKGTERRAWNIRHEDRRIWSSSAKLTLTFAENIIKKTSAQSAQQYLVVTIDREVGQLWASAPLACVTEDYGKENAWHELPQ